MSFARLSVWKIGMRLATPTPMHSCLQKKDWSRHEKPNAVLLSKMRVKSPQQTRSIILSKKMGVNKAHEFRFNLILQNGGCKKNHHDSDSLSSSRTRVNSPRCRHSSCCCDIRRLNPCCAWLRQPWCSPHETRESLAAKRIRSARESCDGRTRKEYIRGSHGYPLWHLSSERRMCDDHHYWVKVTMAQTDTKKEKQGFLWCLPHKRRCEIQEGSDHRVRIEEARKYTRSKQ